MIAHKIKKEENGFEVYVWNGFWFNYIGIRKTKEGAKKLVEDADKIIVAPCLDAKIALERYHRANEKEMINNAAEAN